MGRSGLRNRGSAKAARNQGQGAAITIDSGLVRRLMGRGDDLTLAAEDLADSLGRMADSTKSNAESAGAANIATERVALEAGAVAMSAGQMSSAMAEVASSAAEATSVTAEAGEVTREVRASVHRLTSSTGQIDDVVRTVSGISDQTRLLALNATIEAARAGEAGRGFAVVAEEVKNLAAQTNQATTEIAQKLAELAQDSDAVRLAVQRIDEVLERVDTLQQTIAAAVEEQSAAIAEITRSADEAAGAAEDLKSSVTSSLAAAEAAEDAMKRARTWLTRLSQAAEAQSKDVANLSQGVEVHPLRKATVAHAAWKKKLRTAIETGRLEPGTTLETVARDDACDFGKWLKDGGQHEAGGNRCDTISELHAQFHRTAAAVLTAVSRNEEVEAQRLLASEDGYAGIAAALTDGLLDWIRVVESDNLNEWEERRHAKRVKVDTPITLRSAGRTLTGHLFDVSQEGVGYSLIGDSHLTQGQEIEVEFTIDDQLIRTRATVARDGQPSEEGPSGAAVFVGIDLASREALHRSIEARLEQKAAAKADAEETDPA